MVAIDDLEEGDEVLVRHQVRHLRIDLGLVVTRIVGFQSGMVQFAPIPVSAIESKVPKAP